jgi:hypothetical protein
MFLDKISFLFLKIDKKNNDRDELRVDWKH